MNEWYINTEGSRKKRRKAKNKRNTVMARRLTLQMLSDRKVHQAKAVGVGMSMDESTHV